MKAKRVLIGELEAQYGLKPELIYRFVALAWLHPAEEDCSALDEEDICRARLIHELQEDLGVNDAAVPVILQLLDQLHRLQIEIRRR